MNAPSKDDQMIPNIDNETPEQTRERRQGAWRLSLAAMIRNGGRWPRATIGELGMSNGYLTPNWWAGARNGDYLVIEGDEVIFGPPSWRALATRYERDLTPMTAEEWAIARADE